MKKIFLSLLLIVFVFVCGCSEDKEKYKISFDSDGGTLVQDVYVEEGKRIPIQEKPTKEGYTFIGWYYGDEEWSFINYTVNEDLNLTAKWQANKYTITFDTNGGSEVQAITQDYGTNIQNPSFPEKEGYTFIGWDKEIPSTMPLENITITAKWQVNKYTITFDTNGGSEVQAITQDYGTNIQNPSSPEKEGYTFMGWDKEIPSTMPSENITITAKWQVNKYTITFDTNGGSEVQAITQDYGTNIQNPSSPEKEGYTFMGWDKEIPSTMPSENITITAKWQVNKYTITFDTNGGSEVQAITQDYGTNIQNPSSPEKEGYTFMGWDKEIPSTMPSENITITAKWGKVISISEVLKKTVDEMAVLKGIVSGFHYGYYQGENSPVGCYLTDDTGTIYVYDYILAQSVEKGDEIIIEAKVTEYKTYKQLSEPSLVETISSSNEISIAGAILNKTVSQIAADLTSNYTGAAYIFEKVQIKKVIGTNYVSYVLEDKEWNVILLYSSSDNSEFAWLDQYAGKELKVLFAINSQNSKGTMWRGHVLDVLEVIGDWSGSNNNPGGGNTPVVIGDFLKEVQAGVAYKFVIDQTGVGKKFFFTGTMSGYYGASSENASDAVNVYLEQNGNGYSLYFMLEGAKKYITAVVSGIHKNFTIADAPSTVWTFDTTNYTLTCDLEGTKCYMGTYGTYNTFGVSTFDKLETSFPARFYSEDAIGGDVNNGDFTLGTATATITFNILDDRTEYSTSKQVWKQNGVTITNNKGECVADVSDRINPIRFYANTTLTIEYLEEITKIVINTADGKCYKADNIIEGATLKIEGNNMIITLDTPATSFTIDKLVTQIRTSQIDIYTESKD